MNDERLTLDNLSFSYGAVSVLKSLSISFAPAVTAVVGPNGAGKSTMIKCIAGVLKGMGTVSLSSGERVVDQMSYLPQSLPSTAALTVFETVLLGLVNSLSMRVTDEQLRMVMETLEYLGIEPLATRRLNQLSGGQQQMVSLAQALVKNPKVLLLDEPLNSLDIRYQFEILNKIREITYLTPRITLIAIHDLNLAAKYADSILALHNGAIYAHGRPEEVLTESLIRDLYGMRTEVTIKDGRTPHIRLLSSIERGEFQ